MIPKKVKMKNNNSKDDIKSLNITIVFVCIISILNNTFSLTIEEN